VQLRNDINALKLALEARNQQLAASERAHKIFTSVASLGNSLATGSPVATELASLESVVSQDNVVAAALRSIPEASVAALNGVPTVAQLQVQWPQVQHALRVNAALGDKAEPGLLSSALASLAARLKVGCPALCCLIV
jgi:hypothetical protein